MIAKGKCWLLLFARQDREMSFLSKTNYSKREGEKRGERERKIQLKSSDTSPDVPSITLPHRDTHTNTHAHKHTQQLHKGSMQTHTVTLTTRMTVFIWSGVCFLSCLTVPVDTFSHRDPDWHKRSLKTPPDGEMSSPHKLLSSPLTLNSRWGSPMNSLHKSSSKSWF